MGREETIGQRYGNEVLNIAMNTLEKDKQAIVFVNTRRSAEAQAEKIAEKIRDTKLEELSEQVKNVLSTPTKQCKRLAKCVKKGVAFHHSGLHSKQRDLVEESFKDKTIKVICATPTLAMGVDLPAYRVVIRDLKRYGGKRGMQDIPVLEYEQMSGRAGRPSFDDHGEAICIAKSEDKKERIWDKYVEGDPEEIVSKLAVEPVLRIYVLSLIASEFCNSKEELYDFFDATFYAHQYKDSHEVKAMVDKMVDLLKDWEFVKGGKERRAGFVSAAEMANEKDENGLEATRLGKRVSELYLDPYTANHIIECLKKASSMDTTEFSWLQMISSTLEMRPLLRVKKSEYEAVREEALKHLEHVFEEEPDEYGYEYDNFLKSIKTALFMHDWINEKDEDYLMDEYDIRPGGVHAKLDIADWLLYSAQELANILKFKPLLKELAKLRSRVNYGVKEELLPLLKLKHIGRVRARRLYKNDVKDIGDVKEVDASKLGEILGKKTAVKVKEQVGQEINEEDVPKQRKQGQVSLDDYS